MTDLAIQIRRIIAEVLAWGAGSAPTLLGILLRRQVYRLWFKHVGENLSIEEGVTITGFQNIELGDRVVIMKNSYLYAGKGELSIGDDVSMNTNVYIGANQGRILIGKGCLIGPNCVLRAADHRYSDPDTLIREQGHQSGEIILEDDVWLASNVVVTKDVRIGKGSVIGAQSVVTKDIPPYSIALGVPVKVIHSRKPLE